jgi:uncharacterized protein
MPRVVHFEIRVADPERAIGFYKRVFGWQFKKWDGPAEYWLISTGPKDQLGIDGGLVRREGSASGEGLTSYVGIIAVNSVDKSIASITGASGVLSVPKKAVPGIGWLAYCKDTEGNLFGIVQLDPDVK